MYDANLDKNHVCGNGSNPSQDQSCCCQRCQRTRKFLQLLKRLTIASKGKDYEQEIFATVALISTVCA